MGLRKLAMSLVLTLVLIVVPWCAVYAIEPSSEQVAALERLFSSDDLVISDEIDTGGTRVFKVTSSGFVFEIEPTTTIAELATELAARQYTGLGAVDPLIADLTVDEAMNIVMNSIDLGGFIDLFSDVLGIAAEDIMPVLEEDSSVSVPITPPAWEKVPLVAGDINGVYMRVKTNKSTYALGEVIYATVYVSGLDEEKENEKEVLIRVEGYGIAPVILNANTIDGTASGIVGVVTSKSEAVKLDITVEYSNKQKLIASIPLSIGTAISPTAAPVVSQPNTPVNIELSDEGKKGGVLPKTSDIGTTGYAFGGLTFLVMIICFMTVFHLFRKGKPSHSTISSTMYDRGYTYGGQMDEHSAKEDLNEE